MGLPLLDNVFNEMNNIFGNRMPMIVPGDGNVAFWQQVAQDVHGILQVHRATGHMMIDSYLVDGYEPLRTSHKEANHGY